MVLVPKNEGLKHYLINLIQFFVALHHALLDYKESISNIDKCEERHMKQNFLEIIFLTHYF